MINFLYLLSAHIVGDLILIGRKKKHLLLHCVIWTACVSMVLLTLDILFVWKILFLFVGHYASDKLKMNYSKTASEEVGVVYLFADQVWHIIQLIIVLAL